MRQVGARTLPTLFEGAGHTHRSKHRSPMRDPQRSHVSGHFNVSRAMVQGGPRIVRRRVHTKLLLQLMLWMLVLMVTISRVGVFPRVGYKGVMEATVLTCSIVTFITVVVITNHCR